MLVFMLIEQMSVNDASLFMGGMIFYAVVAACER
jgi:hypothetical protein